MCPHPLPRGEEARETVKSLYVASIAIFRKADWIVTMDILLRIGKEAGHT
jgi:hypothetical protein